jgi:hypothetical protein
MPSLTLHFKVPAEQKALTFREESVLRHRTDPPLPGDGEGRTRKTPSCPIPGAPLTHLEEDLVSGRILLPEQKRHDRGSKYRLSPTPGSSSSSRARHEKHTNTRPKGITS